MEGRGRATSGVTNLVLLGKTGNGKSATANSIVVSAAGNSIPQGNNKPFKSLSRSAPVTTTCQIERVTTKEGRILNVIDTPGLFDPNVTLEFLGKEIVKCIDLAKEGVHGILLVLSVKNRFSTEEASTLQTLQTLFGDKIINYMVVVFTGGDELEANEESLEDYLRDSSPILQRLLLKCNNRKVVFDNRTKPVKENQVTELLKQIDSVLFLNDGHPYTNEMFREAQEWANRRKNIETGGYSKKEMQTLRATMEKQHAEQLRKSAEMVEETLRKSTKMFEQQLAAEESARENVERDSRERICELQQKLRSPGRGISLSVNLPCAIM